jgi:hypothetical protein
MAVLRAFFKVFKRLSREKAKHEKRMIFIGLFALSPIGRSPRDSQHFFMFGDRLKNRASNRYVRRCFNWVFSLADLMWKSSRQTSLSKVKREYSRGVVRPRVCGRGRARGRPARLWCEGRTRRLPAHGLLRRTGTIGPCAAQGGHRLKIRAALAQNGAPPLAWASRHGGWRSPPHGTVPAPTITTPRERALAGSG